MSSFNGFLFTHSNILGSLSAIAGQVWGSHSCFIGPVDHSGRKRVSAMSSPISATSLTKICLLCYNTMTPLGRVSGYKLGEGSFRSCIIELSKIMVPVLDARALVKSAISQHSVQDLAVQLCNKTDMQVSILKAMSVFESIRRDSIYPHQHHQPVTLQYNHLSKHHPGTNNHFQTYPLNFNSSICSSLSSRSPALSALPLPVPTPC
jgi:hypothetical protein